jgi:hypothetical protein
MSTIGVDARTYALAHSFLVRLHGAQSPGEAFQGIDFWSAGNIPGNLLTPNGRRSGEEERWLTRNPPEGLEPVAQ